MVAALYYTHKPISRNLETVNNLDCTITMVGSAGKPWAPRNSCGCYFYVQHTPTNGKARGARQRVQGVDRASKLSDLNPEKRLIHRGGYSRRQRLLLATCRRGQIQRVQYACPEGLQLFCQVLFMLLIICSVYDQQHMYVWCSYSYVNHLLHFVHFFFFSCPLCFVCFLICIWEVDLTVKPMLFVF